MVVRAAFVCFRYKPFLVAEVDSAQTSLEEAEETLREYFRGENAEDKFISRTTPLFKDSNGKLFFMLPGYVVSLRIILRGIFHAPTYWRFVL